MSPNPLDTLEEDWQCGFNRPLLHKRFRSRQEAEPALSRFADLKALVRVHAQGSRRGSGEGSGAMRATHVGAAGPRWAAVSCLRRSAPACCDSPDG